MTSDLALARRSRYGGSRAARALAARHLDRITLLASVVATTPEEARVLARQGFQLALRRGLPFEDALVRAFGQLAAQRSAQDRLLCFLVEVEQRPSGEVAALLGLGPTTGAHSSRPCRGWGLVAGREPLTVAERSVAAAHLRLCRRCRDRHAALERTRARLLGGAAGAVGAVGAAQVVPVGGSAGVGLAALGAKGGAAIVGAVGSAVIATAGTVAVVAPAGFQPAVVRPEPAVSVPASPEASDPPTTTAPPSASPSPSSSVEPTVPVPVPSAVPRRDDGLPLPTSVPLPVPTSLRLPLPTSLPLPLPISPDLP